jgi:hypothetical protein
MVPALRHYRTDVGPRDADNGIFYFKNSGR